MLDDLRKLIADVYPLTIPAEEIASDEPLFGPESRFGLDSIDTLQLISRLRGQYGFDVANIGMNTFKTLDSIEAFLREGTGSSAGGTDAGI